MISSRSDVLKAALQQRILIIDGAMGTMIQRHKLQEEDYRGTRFADWPHDVKGNNDLLVLTKPHYRRHSRCLLCGWRRYFRNQLV